MGVGDGGGGGGGKGSWGWGFRFNESIHCKPPMTVTQTEKGSKRHTFSRKNKMKT